MKLRVCLLVAIVALAACKKDRVEDGGDAGGDASVAPDAQLPDASSDEERAAILGVDQQGEATLPGLQADVQVVYTEGNVPHIYAASLHDAYVAAGYVVARDRYFELDIASRLALGELSSMLGPLALSTDIDSRVRGIGVVADSFYNAMGDDTAAAFDAFATGINGYVAAVKAGELPAPSEYELAKGLLGASSAADLLRDLTRRELAGFAAYVVFESSFTNYDVTSELLAEQLEGHFDGAPAAELRQAGIEQDLFPNILPRHEVSVAPGWGLNGSLQMVNSLRKRPATNAVARDVAKLPPALRARLEQTAVGRFWYATRDGSDKGSNAWAVAADGTASGGTLLAGDGHLALGVPTLFFQMGLDVRTFGDDPLRVVGLYLPGFPYLAVGTNGDIAWSQTYPRADVMDWYREEVQLDANGLPTSSLFAGEQRPLVQTDEQYVVASALGATGGDATWPRWSTFDGRFIQEIEGRLVDDPATETLAAGESIVATSAGYVVPGDEDGDGVITAISLDFTGYDIKDLAAGVDGFQRATSVEQFFENTRGFTGYAQNLVVADRTGAIGFTNFTATPCRDYLPRDADGNWLPGANPQRLLDGTQYGGFEVPFDANGHVVTGDADPQRCMVDYDVFPRVHTSQGYVSNANNDPAGATFDNSLTNDPAYIGGPWVPGYRAIAIADRLDEATTRGATLQDMTDIQGAQQSLVGIDLAPNIIDTITHVRDLADTPFGDLTEAEQRALTLYQTRAAQIDELQTRLQAWLDAGATPASGVETFYDAPTAQDRADAVATMIFNAWIRQWIAAVFADEEIDFLLNYPGRSRGAMMRALRTLSDGRGPGNPANLASWDPATEASVFFDDRTTPDVVEEHDDVMIASLIATLDFLSGPQTSGANGGFGTDEMDAWLWGLRHRVLFDSLLASFGGDQPAVSAIARKFAIDTTVLPLAETLPEGDPRAFLRSFPRPGDLFGIDAANPSFYGDNFDYADGPVMRMAFELLPDGTVRGRNVVPAGQSGLNDSPHFADQAALWLGNDALDVQWAPTDVADAAIYREVLKR